MEWFQAVVLGVLQGLTEFLPISSSAHLRIYPALFGWEDPGAPFSAVVQIGTEAGVILYFIKDIARIINAWVRSLFDAQWRGDEDARMGWWVILGTLPIGVLGFTFRDIIENELRSLWLIGTTLLVFGLVLGLADRYGRTDKGIEHLTVGRVAALGFAQAAALVPGVSRSGATISMGRILGLTRTAATRFAFLLAIPAVLGAGLFQWPSAIAEGGRFDLGPVVVGTLVSFVVGYSVVAWLLRYLQRGTYTPFVVYRVLLGLVTLILLAMGVLQPYA